MELRAYIGKALKKPIVSINKQPHWRLQNWDDIMAFMMYRIHLDKEVHAVADLSDPVQSDLAAIGRLCEIKVTVAAEQLRPQLRQY